MEIDILVALTVVPLPSHACTPKPVASSAPEKTGDRHNAIVKNSDIEEDDEEEEEEEEEAKSLFSTTDEQRKSRELRPRSCR
jgi:ribosomal protein L12E/L44/L45/RPP1/RPP2